MTIEQFDKHHQARPFRLFRLFLSDSRSLLVEHAEYLARSPNGRTIAVFDTQDGSFEAIDLLHVTSLKLTGSAETGKVSHGNNGLTSEYGPEAA